ncbi:hypothetical protein BO70DRAFT_350627 [Aspergillus heteromorphus CBS 117.55]|uniref:Delta(24)-sterol reductase n=1 Tax=Aspergillus heteromorphus CBS 117.55 TaxID=1448321 RepID=A0A317WP24_9EURO|nr:uncharacterized protein BO70DRAFT_350627 [Aspergillus heteromorphus CBS 117.55]PWY88239.1 hypothetical protein BO70DRAFT_350627 [Aspergillus heteromorphus CBS 117.55]
MTTHADRIASISASITQFHRTSTPFRIHHGSTNSTRQFPSTSANTISTAHLTNILSINASSKTITVEPNVPMDVLLSTALSHNLLPLVIMEFPGITVGGGFSGTSGESSSFRHGFFDATVVRIEMILGNGTVCQASRTENPELFGAAKSAFGTMGVVTLLEVQCRDALPYVEVEYMATSGVGDAVGLFRELARDEGVDYLDGIVFGREHVVVCKGKLVEGPSEDKEEAEDKPKIQIQRFTRPHDPWFYIHAQRSAPPPPSPPSPPCSSNSPTTPRVVRKDLVPITDYLFRYDRGAFWTGRYAYSYFLTPFNRVTRYLLDYFMHTRVMYHALHASGHASQYVIQDVAVPYASATHFVDWLDSKENFGAYPIWLCPLLVEGEGEGGVMASGRPRGQTQTPSQPPPVPSSFRSESGEEKAAIEEEDARKYLLNFGLWAPSPHRGASFIAQNRRLEKKVRDLGGKKWLYACAYYTEEEFWGIYDKKRYDGLRERFHAGYLPDLYQKVRVDLDPGKKVVGWGEWLGGLAWGFGPGTSPSGKAHSSCTSGGIWAMDLAAEMMSVPTTLKRRRLLRGEITYSAAKERETNVLHMLGYWDQRNQFFEDIRRNSHLVEATVAHHLSLKSARHCRVADSEEWLSGTFNVCIPVYVDEGKRCPSFLVRLPLPYRVGEKFNPGNADEKVRCEAGTYAWLQQDCPDVPVPRLYGFGLSTGQKFTSLDRLPFLARSTERLLRYLLRFFGYPAPSAYVPHESRLGECLGVGYLLIEYIDKSRGKMLSESWEAGRHNAQLRGNLFRSLSRIILAATRVPQPKIGSFILDDQGVLKLRNRPLTLEIQSLENEQISVDMPRDMTYSTVDSYISDMLALHESRLNHQPNAVNDVQDCLFQMVALTVMRTVRQSFLRAELRGGPFYMSFTDIHQSNIFVDDAWNITCLIDLEWACSRPAEMIHPPFWLTNQSVDEIDPAEYEKLHTEFLSILAEEERKRFSPRSFHLHCIMQDGWIKGTFWYALALDSPTGLFRIFYDHIQPRFAKDHVNDAAFFRIVMDYWAVDAHSFVQRKVQDKELYDKLLLDAFT